MLCTSGFVDNVMFLYNGGNRPESKTTRMFRRLHQVAAPWAKVDFLSSSVERPRSTRSSSVLTLARHPSSSSLKITDCIFSLCFTLPLKSTPFVSSSTSFWYQFLSFPTDLFLHPSLLPVLIYHSAHP